MQIRSQARVLTADRGLVLLSGEKMSTFANRLVARLLDRWWEIEAPAPCHGGTNPVVICWDAGAIAVLVAESDAGPAGLWRVEASWPFGRFHPVSAEDVNTERDVLLAKAASEGVRPVRVVARESTAL